jgi:GntR family transcriptional regulator, trigonelline degradation regulator
MTKNETHAAGRLVTVIEHSVGRLRNAIMQGDLHPGQKLVEAELCRQMGISRASLREVLRILETERLIEIIPNRGPSVAKLGWDEIVAIHDVWALLTGEAVYRFTTLARPEDIMRLRSALAQLTAAVKAENSLRQLAATNALFTLVLERCGNRVLIDVVFSLVSRLNFLRAQSLQYEGWGYLCTHEIQEIIAAIEAKDAESARAATRRHIDSACAAAKQVALLLTNMPASHGKLRAAAASSA